MDIFKDLNPQQKEAVLTSEGPILILAGAGSGKTRVIAHRIAYLIYGRRIPPQNILAVTFTNKAANEMRERVEGLLEDRKIRRQGDKNTPYLPIPLSSRLPYLGTFHSVCVKILRSEIKTLGYKSNFAIFDEGDQLLAVKAVMEKLELDPKQYEPRMILSLISSAKSELISPLRYRQFIQSQFQEIVSQVYFEYEKLLRANHALDFDDLLNKTIEIFRKFPHLLTKYQHRFRYILIDEYQDTNHAQYILTKLLALRHQNICVVGDPDQSIYGWRGADIRNILNFETDFPKTKIIKLEQNYRSTKSILAAASSVIKCNVARKEKELWTDNEDGIPVIVYQAVSEKDEAEFIVTEIAKDQEEARYRDSQFFYSGYVILYRTNAQSRALEDVFLKRGIPYKIVGGVRFYERAEIKDILAYLRLIQNPDDKISLERVINLPKRGIGEATRKLVVGLGLSGWLESNKNSRMYQKVKAFSDLMDDLRQEANKINPVELIDQILKKIKYREYLFGKTIYNPEANIEAESRWENVQELKTVAEKFASLPHEEALAEFLTEVSLLTDIDEWNEAADAITLMTLHNAKGLEFKSVFIVGMEEGLFPHSRSMLEPAELEEERRLCYVGMTRAMKQLYLIYSQSRMIFGSIQVNLRSRFLDEIPQDLILSPQETATIKSNNLTQSNGEFMAGDKVVHKFTV